MPLKYVIALCATFFVLGIVGLYLAVTAVSAIKKRMVSRTKKRSSRPAKETGGRKSIVDRVGTMNLILIVIGVILMWFTVTMIDLFKVYGAIPDTLVNCVFMALAGECGVMGWIKTSKQKYKERVWMKEDMADMAPDTEKEDAL